MTKVKSERGRPMSHETHYAILRAVPEILRKVRYSELTFDRLAAEAGVGKAAIFRRWKSKSELVTDAIRLMFQTSNPEVPCSGNLLADITTFVGNTARMLTATPAGSVIRNIVSELDHEPQLAELMAQLESERRAIILRLLAPLNASVDRDQLISSLFGPIYFRWLITRQDIDDGFVTSCVQLALKAMGTESNRGDEHAH